MPNRRLAVNGDDLGLAESVNRGIAETIESGTMTSASLIVNLPACDDAIRRLRYLRALGKTVSVGLNFNVVTGSPLTHCPSLSDAETGEFLPFPSFLWRSVARKLDLEEVRCELNAQLDRAATLLAKINMRVTHIDSQRHTHFLPGILELVLATAKEKGIPHVRDPYESRPTRGRTKAIVASTLMRAISSPRDRGRRSRSWEWS